MGTLKWVLVLDSIINVWWVITILAVGAIAFGAGIFVKDVYIDEWSCVQGKTEITIFYAPESSRGKSFPIEANVVGESEVCAKEWKKTSIQGPRLPDDADLKDWYPEKWFEKIRQSFSKGGDNL